MRWRTSIPAILQSALDQIPVSSNLLRKRAIALTAWATLLVMLVVGPNGAFIPLTVQAKPAQHTTSSSSQQDQGPSNQQFRKATIPSALDSNRKPSSNAKAPGKMVHNQQPQHMKTTTVTLDPAKPLDFVGSDKRFEFLASAGAITSMDVAAAGGRIQLRIEQLQGPSGGSRTGRATLGTYQITVLDAHQQPLSLFTFHQPLTYIYHYADADLGTIRPDTAFVQLFDGSSLPLLSAGSTKQSAWPSKQSYGLATKPAHNDSTAHTLSYTTTAPAVVSGAATANATFGASTPIASWGTVQDFQADINAGALSFGYPLDVPAGPNSIKPDLRLTYSSGTVNATEGLQAAPSWVGGGWGLQLGSISWSQTQGDATSGTNENAWQITTPDGISGQLIPPNIADTTIGTFTATPIQWYTAPESHAKVIEITASTNGGTYPCFRLWQPDGTLEEYGCTNDSRQWYVDANGNQYTYRWDLDMIADTHGNQIVVTYDQLKRNKPGTSYQQVVDAVLQDIYYDFTACQSTTTRCATSGALVDVHFDSVTNKPARLGGSTTSFCTNWTGTDLCDDPGSPGGGLVAPDIHSAHVLNDVKVNVRTVSTSGWNMLRAYYFWYEQHEGATVTDPASGLQEGIAGYLDLIQFQEFGTNSTTGPTGTAYPPLTFGYSGSFQERYIDLGQRTSSSTNCAPWYTYKINGKGGALDVVAREGSQLVDYWRDTSSVWHKGVTFASNVQSAPSTVVNPLTQNTDVVVRQTDGHLAHYWRNTQGTWSATPELFGHTGFTSAPSLIYNASTNPGTLEVVVQEGTQIAHYTGTYNTSTKQYTWSTAPELFGDSISGDAVIAFNPSNNAFEVVAPRSGQLVHYGRTQSMNTWNRDTFGDTGVTYYGLGMDYNGLTALPGYLELVANENHQLVYYYLKSSPFGWTRFSTTDGINVAAAPGVKLNSDSIGTLEVIYEKSGGQFQHDALSSGPSWVTNIATFGDGNASVAAPGLAYNGLNRCYYDQTLLNLPPPYNQTVPALWSQTLFQRYPSSFDNGRGMHETFSWYEAHMNAWGGYNGQPSGNPLSCTGLETTEPCYRADDRNWSRVVLGGRNAIVNNAKGDAIDTSYTYVYTLTPVDSAHYFLPYDNSNNIQGGLYTWNWGSVNSGDYLNYYNPEYRGFQAAQESIYESHDGGQTGTLLTRTMHTYSTTSGWGVWDHDYVTGISAPGCANSWNGIGYCPTSPYWSAANALPGREIQTDTFGLVNGTAQLLRRVNYGYNTTSYTDANNTTWTSLTTCRPSGEPYTPNPPYNNYWTNRAISAGGAAALMLVSDLSNLSNPLAVCDPRVTSQDTFFVDGSNATIPTACTTSTANISCQHVSYSYDTGQTYSSSHDYGNISVAQTSGNDLSDGQITVQMLDYGTNDNVTTTSSSATGTYIVDAVKQQTTRDTSTSGAVHALTQLYYDSNTTLGTLGSTGDQTQSAAAYQADAAQPSGYDMATSTMGYDGYGNVALFAKPHPGACSYNPGPPPRLFPGDYCPSYDVYAAHVTTALNGKQQQTAVSYANASGGYDATNGFGQWLTSITDANSQKTTYAYDALGRLTSDLKPLTLNNGPATGQYAYIINCPTTGAHTPCIELDSTRVIQGTNVTTRTFSDGFGHTAEMTTPAPNGTDTLVTYTLYDALGRKLFVSEPYTVTPGTTSFVSPDTTKPGTQYAYDGLGRVTSMQLVPSYSGTPTNTTTATYSIACSVATGDGACYEQASSIDPNGHRHDSFANALGQTTYDRTYTGTSSYSVYATTKYQYDVLGNLTMVTHPDGAHTTTYAYDLLSRKTSVSDPDLGSWTFAYDLNGNLVQQTDARGSGGTTYAGYDGLDRPIWRNTTNSSTGAYVTYTYDGTASPSGTTTSNYGVGHLTSETFTSGPSGNTVSGSYSLYYDARGRVYQQDQMVSGTTYTVKQGYNDADQPTSVTYPDGEQIVLDYTFSGAPKDMQSQLSGGSTWTFLVSGTQYASTGQISSLTATPSQSVTLTEALSYDPHQHITEERVSVGGSTQVYDVQIGYDRAYNVTSTTTTLPAVGTHSAGTEHQSFCYDDLNRLVWAGTTGTPSGSPTGTCGPTPAASTLDGGTYIATYAYDTLDRLTTGPAGTYTYGDSAHLHAATSTSGGYTSSYDAAGNMTCRAPSSTTTCSGTQTGGQLTYDNEGRLVQWLSAPTSPTSTDVFVYDGEGRRVQQQTTSGGTTTTTTYVARGLADYVTTGSTTTHTNHYSFAGRLIAVRDSGTNTLHYLVGDQLNSPEEQITGSTGVVEAVALRTPYGVSRYGASQLYTYGFTGQRQDDTTGLDYYNARYYDPALGQFASADTANDGLNRYAYVHGNPETLDDPSGHMGQGCIVDNGQQYCPGGGGPKVTGGKYITDLIHDYQETNADQSITYYYYRIWRTYYSDGSYVDRRVGGFHDTVCGGACKEWHKNQIRNKAADDFHKGAWVFLAIALVAGILSFATSWVPDPVLRAALGVIAAVAAFIAGIMGLWPNGAFDSGSAFRASLVAPFVLIFAALAVADIAWIVILARIPGGAGTVGKVAGDAATRISSAAMSSNIFTFIFTFAAGAAEGDLEQLDAWN